ncbi:MAG: DUF2029 domain-containing protein [Anaerolinea sp.]|nr:DUF2029 domain-containing protein [Anaerolinea sp.]
MSTTTRAAAPIGARVLTARVSSAREWLFIVLIAVVFVIMPQLPENDWFRNAADLPRGLAIYSNPEYVYPPWALILFAPYYLIGAAGSRVASVLIVGALAWRRGWSLAQFLSVIMTPLFLWTMVLSSADVLILLIPILLWTARGRWSVLLRGLAISILLVKPQVGLVLAIPRLWALRRDPRQLVWIALVVALILLPVSLIGSPPLLLQWIERLGTPQGENVGFWTSNNLSISAYLGVIPALLIVGVTLGGVYLWLRRRNRWTDNHTDSALLTASMLVAPYASNQSAIVPLALHPSWALTAVQWILVLGAALLDRYGQLDEWLLLALTVLALIWGRKSIMAQRVAEDMQ